LKTITYLAFQDLTIVLSLFCSCVYSVQCNKDSNIDVAILTTPAGRRRKIKVLCCFFRRYIEFTLQTGISWYADRTASVVIDKWLRES